MVRPKKGAPPRLRRAALAYAAKGNQPDELPVDRAEAARSIIAPAQAVPVGRARTLTLENGMRVVLVPLRGRWSPPR